MRFYLLGACVTLAAFAAVSLGASGALLLLWPCARRRIAALPARSRMKWLLGVRLAPTGLGALASFGLVLPAFALFEPRRTQEVIAAPLAVCAATGFLLMSLGLARLLIAGWKTHRILKAWSAGAEPVALPGIDLPAFRVETSVPVVVLAGWRRPCLYVAASVLDRCDPLLVAAMGAHEAGHLRSFDNLKRLVLEACADTLLVSGTGREMVYEWACASEEAADESALERGAGRADLAQALLSVARLAPKHGWPAVPAAAFFRGEDLERRVRRLLAGTSLRQRRQPRVRAAVATAIVVAGWLSLTGLLLQPVHRLVEHAVNATRAELRALVVGHTPS